MLMTPPTPASPSRVPQAMKNAMLHSFLLYPHLHFFHYSVTSVFVYLVLSLSVSVIVLFCIHLSELPANSINLYIPEILG